MGNSPDAIVDQRVRVHGVDGLPEIVSGNTNALAIMIGEKASDLILADAQVTMPAAIARIETSSRS